MKCNTCGNPVAARVRIGLNPDGTKWELCDECGKIPAVWLPDVFLESGGGVKSNDGLWNSKENRPFEYTTKREKAVIMKQLGLSESGDYQHGARNESYRRRKYI